MFKKIAIASVLLLAVAAFELHPAVEQGRAMIPEEVYTGKACDCLCILTSRPWYSTVNYWFWLWVIGTPLIVFSVKPSALRWQRAIRTLLSIGFCYGVMNLAMHLSWDIRNGPFGVVSYPNMSWQKTWDMPKCANIADGFGLIYTRYLGWIPACLYAGFCLFFLRFYNSSYLKKI